MAVSAADDPSNASLYSLTQLDSLMRAGCNHDKKLMFEFSRSVSAGAAVGAHLFVAFLNDTNQIVGSIAFYGPGIEICGECVINAISVSGSLTSLANAAKSRIRRDSVTS